LENQTIQTKVEIGNNIILWSSNHIGHSSIIGSHSYLSSHITISGNCKIGERCFFGVNSAVKDNCIIGNDVFVGMGSIITNDLKNDSTTLNSSTKIYESDSKINRLLKKKFFNF
jgi:Acyl-[acyl carrier protein]--UDP-N-acetylglucosamine O-acyltransferase